MEASDVEGVSERISVAHDQLVVPVVEEVVLVGQDVLTEQFGQLQRYRGKRGISREQTGTKRTSFIRWNAIF